MKHRTLQHTCLLVLVPLLALILIGAVNKSEPVARQHDLSAPKTKAVADHAPHVSVTTQRPMVAPAAVPAPPTSMTPPKPVAASATFEVRWSSINAGGGRTVSPNYASSTSSGQTTAGTVSSPSFEAGGGFWEGTEADTSSVICSCPFQCDFDADGFLDALDLNALIEALFFSGPNPTDPACPATRGDFDVSGFPDALDLNALIEHLFFGGAPPSDPCT